MKICGLITEYNPFHNGHRYHLETSKQKSAADYAVAVMSGHFLQRGEPALLDKWTRAAMAVRCGVDLVVELPVYYATASAQYFAEGAIALLDRMAVDSVSFGSESGDVNLLAKVADALQDIDLNRSAEFAQLLQSGMPYHAARQRLLQERYAIDFDFSANNILAVSYLRAAKKRAASATLATVKRCAAGYHDSAISGTIASATAIRGQLDRRPVDWRRIAAVMPEAAFNTLYDSSHYTYLNDFKALVNSAIIRAGRSGLAHIRGVSEGLENRLLDNISNVMSLEDLVDSVASKRYPKTRIRRLLINILLGIEQFEMQSAEHNLDYARILAFNENGRKIIKHVKRNGDLTLFSNLARDLKKYRRANPLIDLDIRATGIYSQVNRAVHIRSDYTMQPIEV